MNLKNYYVRKDNMDFMGFLWQLDKETTISIEFSNENHGLVDAVIFKELLCKLIFETIHQKPYTQVSKEEEFLKYCEACPFPFGPKDKTAKLEYPSLEEFKEDKPEKGEQMEFIEISRLLNTLGQEKGVLLCNTGSLYSMDSNENYQLMNKSVVLVVRDLGDFKYLLEIYDSKHKLLHTKAISSELNYHIDTEKNLFKWVHFSEKGLELLALQFHAFNLTKSLQFLLNKCSFEANKRELLQEVIVKKDDRELVDNYFAQQPMEIEPELQKEFIEEEELVFQEEDLTLSFMNKDQSCDFRGLAQGKVIGDRAFALKGDVLSVYKTENNQNISHIIDYPAIIDEKKEKLTPKKILLQEQDTKVLLLAAQDQQKVFYYDLEKGKVIQELQADEFNKITEIAPENKYAVLSNNPVFLAINDRNIFKLDPRVNTPKEAAVQKKVYSNVNNFQSIATTNNGHFALGNKEGEIRLFKEVGQNAKNLYPGLGDPIIYMDCTKDGRFILATCKNYLVFLTTCSEGRNGFTHTLKNAEKATPRVLKLQPKTLVQYNIKDLQFIQGKFDEKENDKEKYIVANSKELVVTWSLKNVLEGKVLKYEVKKIGEDVVVGEFKYNTEDKFMVMTKKELGMQKVKKVNKKI